jgi:hypothetical protein
MPALSMESLTVTTAHPPAHPPRIYGRRKVELMPDPRSEQRRVFLRQRPHFEGRSPLYTQLCSFLADADAVQEIVEFWDWDTPLRFLAGLHYLVLSGRANWDDVPETLVREQAFLRGFVATQAVQTNEVQRAWCLLPCFLLVSRLTGASTLDLVELGSSAGLNLLWDRYRYSYGAGDWSADTNARVALCGAERTPVPQALLRQRPNVRSRIGIDLSPIDAATAEGRLLLQAFIWPGQERRAAALDEAIGELRHNQLSLLRGDIVSVLPRLLNERPVDGLTVVFETAVMGYLPPSQRDEVLNAIEAAGRDTHLAFVSSGVPEGDIGMYTLTVTIWPSGEVRTVAIVDFHGAWLDWRTAATSDSS